MASATQQQAQLAFAQSRRQPRDPSSTAPSQSSLPQPADRGAALRMAQSLATGQRDTNASLDRQIAGEIGARVGQAVGAYAGGVGAPIGKRIGRVAGENWRTVALVLLLQMALPTLLFISGLLLLTSVIGAWEKCISSPALYGVSAAGAAAYDYFRGCS